MELFLFVYLQPILCKLALKNDFFDISIFFSSLSRFGEWVTKLVMSFCLKRKTKIKLITHYKLTEALKNLKIICQLQLQESTGGYISSGRGFGRLSM